MLLEVWHLVLMVEQLFLVVDNKTIKLWNLKDGTIIKTLERHTTFVISVTFSPDGEAICASGGNTIILCDSKDGKIIKTLEGNIHGSRTAAFSPDGGTIASDSSEEYNQTMGCKRWQDH